MGEGDQMEKAHIIKTGFCCRVFNLVEELKLMAGRGWDPLFEMDFRVELNTETSADHELEYLIVIRAAYTSGGGVETSYMLNKSLNFKVGKQRVPDIIFSDEAGEQSGEPVPLSRAGPRSFRLAAFRRRDFAVILIDA